MREENEERAEEKTRLLSRSSSHPLPTVKPLLPFATHVAFLIH